MAGGTFTGASLNPARTLGPALLSGQDIGYVVPYLIAIFAGGIVAGLLHTFVLHDDAPPPAAPDYPLTEADQKRSTTQR
jgi:hypothetical protein